MSIIKRSNAKIVKSGKASDDSFSEKNPLEETNKEKGLCCSVCNRCFQSFSKCPENNPNCPLSHNK